MSKDTKRPRVTMKRCLARLEAQYQAACEDRNIQAAINAVMAQAKLAGLLHNRHQLDFSEYLTVTGPEESFGRIQLDVHS